MNDELKLKPCPFCGSKTRIVEWRIGDSNTIYYRAECADVECPNGDYNANTPAELAAYWNTRPLEDGFRYALEQVSIALRKEIIVTNALRAELAQAREQLSGYLQAMGYLSGIAPHMPINVNEPMRMAETIYVEFSAARARIEQLEAERRWISVEERLPEEGEVVRVHFGGCDTALGYWYPSATDETFPEWRCWYFANHSIDLRKTPINWQPLPEPPEGEG